MTTAIDSNISIALWNEDDSLNTLARSALDAALGRGSLVISASVFAELLAAPSRTEAFLDSFCKDTGTAVDWDLDEGVWRAAGRAFQQHQAAPSERASAVPPGGLLRAFLRGRDRRRPGAPDHADFAQQGKGRRHSDVRRAVSCGGRIYREAGPQGLPRGHLRSDGGPP